MHWKSFQTLAVLSVCKIHVYNNIEFALHIPGARYYGPILTCIKWAYVTCMSKQCMIRLSLRIHEWKHRNCWVLSSSYKVPCRTPPIVQLYCQRMSVAYLFLPDLTVDTQLSLHIANPREIRSNEIGIQMALGSTLLQLYLWKLTRLDRMMGTRQREPMQNVRNWRVRFRGFTSEECARRVADNL